MGYASHEKPGRQVPYACCGPPSVRFETQPAEKSASELDVGERLAAITIQRGQVNEVKVDTPAATQHDQCECHN
jgi:hypothetical protein